MVKTRVIKEQQKKLIKDLKELIEKGSFITTGDVIVEASSSAPVGVFVNLSKEVDEKLDDIWFATPVGLPLFRADDFHEWCKEKASIEFMKTLGKVMTKSKGILGLS